MKTINRAPLYAANMVNNDSTPVVANSKMRGGVALFILTFVALIMCIGCQKETTNSKPIDSLTPGVIVLNEGNFMASNASMTFYDYASGVTKNDIFSTTNNAPLGDVPTSMTVHGNKGFITLSNSGKIYIVDPMTCRLTGKITGLNSPRYIQFITPNKAYVTNVMSSVIDIIDPEREVITGRIDLAAGQHAEQMILRDGFVYTNLWSYGTQMLKIDTQTDKVVDSLYVGIQPLCLQEDKNGNFWTLADGGYEGNPIGFTDPEIICINPKEMKVTKRFVIPKNPETQMYRLLIAVDRASVYFINKHLYKMSIDDQTLPQNSFIASASDQNFYTLGIDPNNSHIFVSDAIDFMQPGNIMHYDPQGTLIDTFKAGIIPGAFCFIK